MRADELQVPVLLINDDAVGLGGTCVNVGCLPTKHLLHVGSIIYHTRKPGFRGLDTAISFDFREIIRGKDEVVGKLRRIKYEEVLKGLSYVEYVEGHAKLLPGRRVQVDGETYSTDRLIIATGSSPFIPPIKGINDVDYLTNIEVLNLRDKPDSMIILGGGPLGVEFAQMFSRFGTKIYLLQQADRIVMREEPELARLLQGYLMEEGIEIYTKVGVKEVKGKGETKIVKAAIDGELRIFEGERLLLAAGRRANTLNLGLEKLDIKLGSKREIIVDREMKAAENVWAAGDVTGEPMLETVAAKEGRIAANNALSKDKLTMDYRVIPHAVFTDPQLAGVGLTDEQAISRGISCRCNTVPIELVPKAQAIKDVRGAIKMVIDNESQEILGIHILASGAADLIHEGA